MFLKFKTLRLYLALSEQSTVQPPRLYRTAPAHNVIVCAADLVMPNVI